MDPHPAETDLDLGRDASSYFVNIQISPTKWSVDAVRCAQAALTGTLERKLPAVLPVQSLTSAGQGIWSELSAAGRIVPESMWKASSIFRFNQLSRTTDFYLWPRVWRASGTHIRRSASLCLD